MLGGKIPPRSHDVNQDNQPAAIPLKTPMPDDFPYDVFLSHSAKDKAVVRPLAERLRADGATKFGTRNAESGIARLCMSADAFGSDWAQLESGTCGRGNLPFRDPLNKERRFLPLRLDDAPIKGSLAQRTRIHPPR